MYVSLAFWIALLLPGYVVIRRLSPRDLAGSGFGLVALSFLMTMVVLSPVAILGYLVSLPVWIFADLCLAAIVLAAVEITRRGWWPETGRLLLGALSVEIVVVLIDVVMGTRAGSFLAGDAIVHVGRIRFLLDHGLSNLDPNFAEPYFFPIYHTNILHALCAACTKLSPTDHVGVWFAGLGWAKLLIASAIHFLTWTVFRRQWPAWVAVMFVVARTGPVSFLLYPNQMAPWFMMPLLIAFAVQACEAPARWKPVIKLALGTFVLGQVHGLYGVYAALVIPPVLGVALVVELVRNRTFRAPLAVGVLAATCAMPFPVISSMTRPAWSGAAAVNPTAPDVVAESGQLIRLDNGWVMRNPQRGFAARLWRPLLLVAAMVAAACTPRRGQAAVVFGVTVAIAVALFVPPVCTALLERLSRDWILLRIEGLFRIGFAALVFPVVAFLLAPRVRPWWARAFLSLVVLGLSTAYERHEAPLDWPSYLRKAPRPAAERLAFVGQLRRMGEMAGTHIPAGAVVLADEYITQRLVMMHDCYGVASKLGSVGVPDIDRRRRDLKTMTAPATPWPARRELLEKYDVTYFVPHALPVPWLRDHIAGARREEKIIAIVQLQLDDSPAPDAEEDPPSAPVDPAGGPP